MYLRIERKSSIEQLKKVMELLPKIKFIIQKQLISNKYILISPYFGTKKYF